MVEKEKEVVMVAGEEEGGEGGMKKKIHNKKECTKLTLLEEKTHALVCEHTLSQAETLLVIATYDVKCEIENARRVRRRMRYLKRRKCG